MSNELLAMAFGSVLAVIVCWYVWIAVQFVRDVIECPDLIGLRGKVTPPTPPQAHPARYSP